MKNLAVAAVLLVSIGIVGAAEKYSWRNSHAKVTVKGELQWAPQPFAYRPGKSIRYIDYAMGSDSNDGKSKTSAWKHHPWDAGATGKSRSAAGVDTFVFKRGISYRGTIVAKESGRPGDPIRFTSDPKWGEGLAILSGSELVGKWKKGASNRKIPNGPKVWYADLDYAPRYVWTVDKQGRITNIPIARTPNWRVSDPQDVMSQWYVLQQPQWWKQQDHQTKVNGRTMHRGTDKKHLTRSADYYVGAKIWSEWGIVMGTPFPSLVEAYDSRRKAVAYQGIWWGASGRTITGNRYFLEDKPHYLDAPGEHWFEKKGSGGRLFIRLPGDADPNKTSVEAAKRYNIIEDICSAKAPYRLDILRGSAKDKINTTGVRNLDISGLAFRFNNTWWNTEYPVWMHNQIDSAAIRFRGSCDGVRIANCRFEHVVEAVQVLPITGKVNCGDIAVTDNVIEYTGDDAVNIAKGPGSLQHVDFLRNKLYMIGMRPNRQGSGHAVTIGFPVTMEVAGNFLNRTYGAGLFLFGGKTSGASGDVPLARYLVHHNRVEDTLLAANDWGGIETWQGGPFYVYNNISANPGGLWWPRVRNPEFGARLGFAYYLDGSFKNYLFNNIAWGRNNDRHNTESNAFAFYEAVGTIHNSYMNNTIYRFQSGSSWSPRGGHHRWAGNLWSDISNQIYTHGKLKEDKSASSTAYPYATMAYGPDVFHKIKSYGHFENLIPVKEGKHETFASMQAAVKKNRTLNAALGISTNKSPMRDPAGRDMRLVRGSAAIDWGVRHFVPWGLYGVVGEWNFYHAGGDVATILDEHWYMTNYLTGRGAYHQAPQFPLKAVNVTEASYVQGPLESWVKGALQLNGKNQYLVLDNAWMNKPYTYERRVSKGKTEKATVSGDQLKNPQIHATNFLIEIYFKATPGRGGSILVEKMGAAGYGLRLNAAGGVTLTVRGKGAAARLNSKSRINDGKWRHVIAEADRTSKKMTIYIDGRADASARGIGPESLASKADLHIGGSARGECLKGSIEFVRICQGTLKDARTTIEELHAWQFDGPQFRDFAGNEPTGKCRDAGALELAD
ncbi:MAG: LamG domain-containing protein [Phycisphaerae bacterium]|jgi:hypothetical protein|nr:LamG domain-containing protein [Phycisphaerae bacterium]